MLYIVSTPIGNLKDITLRALEVLKSVDLIACEDTRRTRKLTDSYAIKTPLTSYFEYNKITKGEYLIRLLKEGSSIALVSDSGTPGISDPGFSLIRQAIDNGILVTVVPGPVGLVAGLIVSGKPTHKFVFEGFLPSKRTARLKRLGELSTETRTIVFYESPHRLVKLLEDIEKSFAEEKEIVCIRELTKKFEEIKRGKAGQLLEHFRNTKPRGEFVVVI